ncbi:heavy metal sensor histidine kinase [Xanthomonas massiliensis]|uniref:heavy metal sensor histidine kinase n=1 Tax=Xanthomonas massiliensis TaxID=1720302 RepID=UPI00098F46A2|nr:heavy metal sensor histidine kinase [Xanthomonas massiliensis]
MIGRSLATRLGGMFGLAVVGVLSIAAVALFVFMAHELQRHKREELHARFVIVERLARHADTPAAWQHLAGKVADFSPDDGSLYFLADSADPRFAFGGATLHRMALRDTGDQAGRDGEVYRQGRLDGQRYLVLEHLLPASGARPPTRLMIASAMHDLDRTVVAVAVAIGLILLLSTLAVFALGWRIARLGLAPADRLSAHARQLGGSDLGRRLPEQDLPAELEGLVVSFNGALERLEHTCLQLSAFNADVAHELRTPLANLIGETQVALSRSRTARALEDVLQSNLEELERLRRIVNAMLFLARADRGETARDRQEVSLRAETLRAVEFMDVLLEDAGIAVVVDGDAGLPVEDSLYAMAITNLLDNALRHGDGGPVHIRIDAGAATVNVTVANPAAALAPEQLDHLFDRFYRPDPARTGSRQGHGLGLAIVRAIVQLHGGRVDAHWRDGMLSIAMALPRPVPAAAR